MGIFGIRRAYIKSSFGKSTNRVGEIDYTLLLQSCLILPCLNLDVSIMSMKPNKVNTSAVYPPLEVDLNEDDMDGSATNEMNGRGRICRYPQYCIDDRD